VCVVSAKKLGAECLFFFYFIRGVEFFVFVSEGLFLQVSERNQLETVLTVVLKMTVCFVDD